mgnify:CR=1 FL=1
MGAAANWFYADNNYPFYVENGVASEHLRRANSRMQTAQTELHARQRWTHSQLHAAASFYHNHRRLPGPVVLYVNDNNEQLTEQQASGRHAGLGKTKHGAPLPPPNTIGKKAIIPITTPSLP